MPDWSALNLAEAGQTIGRHADEQLGKQSNGHAVVIKGSRVEFIHESCGSPGPGQSTGLKLATKTIRSPLRIGCAACVTLPPKMMAVLR